ncbi:sugar nucleotide-binding protein [Streptomyces roseolus]|uniref:sugar nucleotide-binding protein n=1 Tax=Streptomyces roseolus TaxID=67358 RepID=UPI003F4D6FDE
MINATSGGADGAVTAEGGIRLAQAAAGRGTRLVHVSSDAVLSGTGRDRHDESCFPDPLTPYGAGTRSPLRRAPWLRHRLHSRLPPLRPYPASALVPGRGFLGPGADASSGDQERHSSPLSSPRGQGAAAGGAAVGNF